MFGGALHSPDGAFRYHLLRRWAPALRSLVFVMLNPSTADAEADDPTIRRCIGFGRALGYGSIEAINLYAFRATDPNDLRAAGYPVGDGNGEMFEVIAAGALAGACDVCAAWGTGAAGLEQPAAVRRFFANAGVPLLCLGTTKGGHPAHPLYLPADAALRPLPP